MSSKFDKEFDKEGSIREVSKKKFYCKKKDKSRNV